jgi:hypothetical protein
MKVLDHCSLCSEVRREKGIADGPRLGRGDPHWCAVNALRVFIEIPALPRPRQGAIQGPAGCRCQGDLLPQDNSDPQALHPTGIVAADGTFTLSSHETDDGAPAGDYIVAVVWPDTSAKGSDSIKQPLHDRLRGAYSNPDKQVLHAQVTIGDNELPAFELR